MIKRFYILLLAIVASVGMSWAAENSITINGTPQVGDNSISLTYYFDPANVPGITSYAPTLKVKCVTDNIWDEVWLSLHEISSGTENITLETLGSFQAGKEYAVCYAYFNGSWVDEVFQSFSFPAAPAVTGTTWTSLSMGDVIKVGDQLSPSVDWESANDYGVIKSAWAPYTLLRANIVQEHEYDDPVVTEAEDGAYYVFKFTHPTSGTSYLLANSAKSPLLAATATSDGLEVTNVGDDYGTPAFTFAVHDGGGSTPAPTPTTTDLASITGDYTAQDGEILTGTLGVNVQISIAPGATVTLNGVDINGSGTWTGGDYAGITCPGNATIILADGTVNRIKGFLNGNSAIHIKPNYTLTIEGDGTLYASTQGGAAAIGCGYSDAGGSRNGGNIVINGGTIYANGGSLAAGIGGGGRATIGNITINGGIIYAVGGGTGAGIGGGQSKSNSWKSICGNITISSNVKYLKATKGSGAEHSIGKGSSSYSVCGTVTIPDGATGYVSTSPYVYCNPDYVIELINAIPQPVVYTDECKAAIDEARAMYTALTDDQKTSVTNYSTLTDAEEAYAALLVEDKIAAIGTVEYTAESKALIDAARTAYDALSDEAKALVTNYSTLTDAETAYAALIQAGADAVIAKINEIPSPMTAENTKLAVYDKVLDARAAYDALTAEQKALVSNYSRLTDAEEAFAAIGGGAPAGALNGKFTINADGDQIAFAKGNLQATTEDLGANWTWGFAAHQYDFVGDAAANNAINGDKSVSANGSVDIFGWSTEATYYGIHNSEDNATYSGDFKDWGSNIGEGWRTLSSAEWIYLLKTRTDASSKFGMATVADVHGMIVLPDDYAGAAINSARDAWDNNIISASDWAAYEAAGVVFLPAGGNREGKYVYLVGSNGHYWSSTNYGEEEANSIYFGSDFYKADGIFSREYSHSVRLVTSNEGISPIAAAQAAVALINAIPSPVAYDEASRNAIKAAREALDALGANASLLDEVDLQKLTDAEAAYAQLLAQAVKAVKDQIDALPATPLTDATKKLSEYNKVTDAREAYDALTDEEKAAVTNYDKLEAAEAAFAAIDKGAGTVYDSGSVALTDLKVGDILKGGVTLIGETTDKVGLQSLALNGEKTDGQFTLSFEFMTPLLGENAAVTSGSMVLTPIDEDGNAGDAWIVFDGSDIAEATVWLNGINSAALPSVLNDAQAAVDKINAIPSPVVLSDECNAAIKAAREAVDALGANASLLDKADLQKLTDAEAALTSLNQAVADEVIAKINNIPTPVELKLATRDSINNARAAYDALNAAQQALVSNYQTLLDAEAALAELNKGGSASVDIVWDINTGIESVATNTTSPAYDGITITTGNGNRFYQTTQDPIMLRFFFTGGKGSYAFAKEDGTHFTKVALISSVAMGEWLREPSRIGTDWLVSDDYKKATWTGDADTVKICDGAGATAWVDVDSIVFTVSASSTPLDSAQAVKGLIESIRESLDATEACGAEIAAALDAYDALSDAAKGALDAADVQKLNDAATQYPALDAIAAIDMIPAEITYDPMTKSYIEIAKAKYDALSDASEELVPEDKVQKLTNALEAWAILAAKIEHNVSYIGKDGELKNEKVALLHIPDPAPDFNGYEFVRWDVKAGDFLEEGLRIKAVYTPIITTNPVAYDTLVYNGTAQTLVTAGVAKEGHIEYRINDGEWSAELPQATFAAAYVVYYKLVREGHEDYLAGSIAATIAKAPVTYTAPTAVETLVYNASNQTLIAAGQTNDGIFEYTLAPNDEESWNTELPQAKDAGTYSVYYRVQGDLNHLDSTAVDPIAVTIAKAELTATADNKAIIFGELAPQFTVTYAGWQGDDDASVLTGDIAYATPYVRGNNVGEYTITPSGVDAANYTITFVDGTLTVNRKSAESSDIMAAQEDDEQLVYTNAVNKPTLIVKDTTLTLTEEKDYTLTFVGRGETEYTESATAPTHVGEYTAKIEFIGNYKDMLTVDFTISKAQLTITADDKENIFGEEAPEFTVSYEGFLGTDTKDVLTGSQAYACEYKRGDNVGDYTIVPSGVDAHDYVITFVNGTLTVNRKSAKDADIVAAQLAGEALVYDAEVNRPTIVVTDTTLTLTEEKDYVLTFIGTANDASVYEESAVAPVKAGDYTAIVAFVGNYIDTLTVDFTVSKAPLTITADDKEMIYGDEHPEFTVSYDGFLGTDDNSVLLGTQGYSCVYAPGSYIGTYAITPKDVTAYDYAITFVDGTLTVNKAVVKVVGAEAQIAKIEDGNTDAVVLNAGQLEGIKLNDAVGHETTASFSDATVGENKTITLFYELTGDAALLANYDLIPTSNIFTAEGVIIEDFIPAEEGETEKEDEEAQIEEGIEVYAYGYCLDDHVYMRYHLNRGNPDQYKIEFADNRFTDVNYGDYTISGPDGTIEINIPVDMPTGDYQMTVTFRDSRFDWLESNPFTVTFHVNLPETYVKPLFENTIVLVDTCNCFTDIQWYHRADASEAWQPIAGATGHYYRPEGGAKLTGEFFVKASMNGEPTYTCGQTDMETLYGADKQQPKATVKAFPNPVVNSTTVTIENSENWNHSLRVVNTVGIEMFHTTFEGNETELRMDGFVQGNYMISVDGIVVKVMKK